MELLRILADQKEEIISLDTSRLINRPEEKELNIHSKFAQVVIGVRRCGKSTLCQKVLKESRVKFGYVNFDDERLKDITSKDFDQLLTALYRLNGDFKHLFLDEVQNIKDWQLFVNRILRQGLRLVITGSNANLLSSDLSTHLTGRYNEIVLYPFSFAEYCTFTHVNPEGLSTRHKGLIEGSLDEYLRIGGLPEVVEGEAPKHYGRHLIKTIIKKDVAVRYRIRYEKVLEDVSNLLLENIGHIISPVKIADKLGVKSYHTIENYISYLSNAYLIFTLRKYSTKAIERKTASKGYAIDMSFVNDHEDFYQPDNLGWRLENIIALELLRRMKGDVDGELYYGAESREYDVDFVVTHRGHVRELIQVCYDFSNPKARLYEREVGNLVKAAKKLKCTNLTLIIREGEPRIIEEEGFSIKVVRSVRWLLKGPEEYGD